MKIGTVILHRKSELSRAQLIAGAFKQWGTPILIEADFGIKPEHDWRNDGLRMAKDQGCELTWIIDADEYLEIPDQVYIVEKMQNSQKDIAMVSLRNYKTKDTALKPLDHCPIVMVNARRPNQFYVNRCMNLVNAEKYVKIQLHHLGMLKTEEELQAKLSAYQGTDEYDVFDRMMHSPGLPVAMTAETADFIDLYLGKPEVKSTKKAPAPVEAPKAEPVAPAPVTKEKKNVKRTRSNSRDK